MRMVFLLFVVLLSTFLYSCGGSSSALRDGFAEVGETVAQAGETVEDGVEEAEETVGQAVDTIEDGISELAE